MGVIGGILMAVGGIVMLGCSIWLLVLAFQESILWLLGCLFVPFVGLVFVVMHWNEAKKPFLISLAGTALYIIGIFLVGPGLDGAGQAP